MKKLLDHSPSFSNHVKSVSLIVVLILFYSAIAQAQSSDPFSLQNQTIIKIFQSSQAYLNPPTTSLNQQNNTAQWETIQSVEISQPGPSSDPFKVFKVGVKLEQVRNGSGISPVVPPAVAPWVSGNAGASNAHFAEGWSIPYKCEITDLAPGNHSIDIEWDTRTSGASAIDFVTNYDLIDFGPGSHVLNFNHVQEVINPIVEAGTWVQGTSTDIPAPNFLNASAGLLTTLTNYRNSVMAVSNVSGLAKKFSIWNGTITSMSYIAQGSVTANTATSSLRIFFTSTVPAGQSTGTVIIAWGGHIAKGPGVWGNGNSAGNINGSSYHSRMVTIDLDGDPTTDNATTIGQQDRSLSTDAVLDPPICNLNGPNSLQCSATSTFTSGVATSDLGSQVVASWAISSDCTGASIVSSDVGFAVVNAGTECGCTFTLSFTLMKSGLPLSAPCMKEVSVTDNVAPTITCPADANLACGASTAPGSTGSATATDNCGGAVTISFTDAAVASNCTGRAGINRTWKATDACSNTSSCLQQIRFVDNTPPVITCPADANLACGASIATSSTGSATATDNCGGSVNITFTDAAAASNCTGQAGINRTWKATDGCNNTSTCLQQIRFVDNTPPTITCPVDANLECGASTAPSSTGSATATDNCGGAVTISFTDAAVASNCTGRAGINRTWKATDACNNTSTCLQQIRFVDNTAPGITCPADANLSCGASTAPASTGSATATDNCGGPVNISFTDAPVASNCTGRAGINRTWKATDGCNNTSTCLQQIRFIDNTAPTITCPPDAVVDCNGSTGTATATDNCDVNVAITFTDQPANSTNCVIAKTRIWKATDDCGNTASCAQRIIVRDRTGPVIDCVAGTATDACSGVLTIYLNNGVWTAIDGAGNITTANASNCVQNSSRLAASQVTEETQPQQTITEEKTKAKAITKAPLITSDIKVNAVPNPFNDRVKFIVTAPEAGYGTLDIMNMLGQKVKTVFQGHISAGGQSFEMVLPKTRNTTLFYILRMNGKQVTGKLVQMN